MSSTGMIGGVVGPIALRPSGSGTASYTSADVEYTCAIGGIPFFLAPKDDSPYQRATAQFRKEQFDASPTPGDQSLDGMWLRGQFSFHNGAGVRFFESLDGDASTSRFFDCQGVDPWTPGEVSLAPNLELLYATPVIDAAGRRDGSTPYVFAITNANAVDKIEMDGTVTNLTSGLATTICANDLSETFVTAGNKVQRATTGDFSDLITQSSARPFVKVAWAKGRLFFVDDSGQWYAKPTSVATVTDADSFWDSGYTSAVGDWTVAESPSAVYLGRGSNVYSVLPSTDGTVPTLQAPVVAATLPPGETIRALGFSLGWLIVVTDAGVRVAESSETGALSMGPILIEFSESTCRQIALWRDLAYVTGKAIDEDTESVWALNLTRVLDTNVVAYARRLTYDEVNTNSGAVHAYDHTITFGDEGVRIGSSSVVTDGGSITTGSIRFGTMEPKAFVSLRIKAEGDDGSITIEQIRRGGVAETLTSLTLGGLLDTDVQLNIPAPEESVGLRFTLHTGASGVSPTLLGYQLRALPAPAKRTRMISIPIQCYDSEEAPNGVIVDRGVGSAYQRLAALEEMEESAGIVLWQDFRTGEQCQAFIEEISFTNRTPPSRGSKNFGGLLNLTLRKVA